MFRIVCTPGLVSLELRSCPFDSGGVSGFDLGLFCLLFAVLYCFGFGVVFSRFCCCVICGSLWRTGVCLRCLFTVWFCCDMLPVSFWFECVCGEFVFLWILIVGFDFGGFGVGCCFDLVLV